MCAPHELMSAPPVDPHTAALRQLCADGTPAPAGAASGSFSELCDLYAALGAQPKYTAKTALVAAALKKFNGNVYLFVRLLLPNKILDHRAYGLKDKSMAKLFGTLFRGDPDEFLAHAKRDVCPRRPRARVCTYACMCPWA